MGLGSPKLSKRMRAIAEMVPRGMPAADIGTDHAYLPIYLVQEGRIPGAIAADLREEPLERARGNIAEYGLISRIECRISDGLLSIGSDEAASVIISGMGGELIVRILSEWDAPRRIYHGEAAGRDMRHIFVLQPQSRAGVLRRYLRFNGAVFSDEDFIKEGGKYYPVMRVCFSDGLSEGSGFDEKTSASGISDEIMDEYGPVLLQRGDPVLYEYLAGRIEKNRNIYKRCAASERGVRRMEKIEREILMQIKAAEYIRCRMSPAARGESRS